MHFQILIFNGFDELDAIAPYEVLQHAVRAEGGHTVELVTVEAAVEIIAGHGLRIRPSGLLDLEKKPDLLIVPGGGWIDRSSSGAFSEAQRGVIPKAIKSLYEAGTICASVCTGAMLLAEAGILKKRPATTHHGAIKDLEASGANVVHARVVDDGNVITAGGVTSGLDLALWLVERFYSPQLAHKIETEMEYERRGTVWKNAS
ncbi:MAG TPA: DJ-1/PfpI family protein [Candidatus Sulfotelmatobacter sp.]|nr:DJ-1/PfpI family protein [Candidatus Sulfotelmatobacter sp.]